MVSAASSSLPQLLPPIIETSSKKEPISVALGILENVQTPAFFEDSEPLVAFLSFLPFEEIQKIVLDYPKIELTLEKAKPYWHSLLKEKNSPPTFFQSKEALVCFIPYTKTEKKLLKLFGSFCVEHRARSR